MIGPYDELVLEHARAPRGVGLPPGAQVAAADNASCGDRVRLGVRVEAGRIGAAGHDTEGCALCVASASICATLATGLTIGEALAAGATLVRIVHGDADAGAPASLRALGAVSGYPVRRRCVLLPWETLARALR